MKLDETLQDINILPCYRTDNEDENPAITFYNPVLSKASTYKRMAGYFSSSSFAFIGSGLKDFILNEGLMKFIFNVKLSEEDYLNISLGYDSPQRIIESKFLSDFDTFEDECIFNHAKVLGWLIAHNYLEIKIGYIENNVSDLDYSKNYPGSIVHEKLGIIEDKFGNTIAFSGSNNESANGWIYNSEHITTFCSWKVGQKEYVDNISDTFNEIWENNGKKTRVLSFPDAVREKLIQIAPKDKNELSLILNKISKTEDYSENKDSQLTVKEGNISNIKLRRYQEQAVEAWFSNGCSGIFEMATGTGKTITALAAYSNILSRTDDLILLVVCPYSHLPTQWERAIRNMNIDVSDFLKADGTIPNWYDQIYRTVLRSHNSKLKRRNIVIFATNDTASSERFRDLFEKIQSSPAKKTWMAIFDEVHSIGTTVYRKALFDEYKYRLGLSATPDRYFDKEGTDLIKKYFSGIVFEFSLREAIDNSYLVPYEYNVRFTNLTSEESEEYIEYTRKIIGLKAYIESDGWTQEKEDNLQNLYNNRAKILKNASNKITIFDDIISNLLDSNNLSHTLIYCSDSDPSQINTVNSHLYQISDKRKRLISRKKYTQSDSARVLKRTGKSERDQILIDFDEGIFDVLLAMKCLDEGVDVPSTKTAILMCSSGNIKEYIQRRGRILRPYPGKDKAVLYDIAVLPPLDSPSELSSTMLDIIEKEKRRLKEFAKDAINNPDIDMLVSNYIYGKNK